MKQSESRTPRRDSPEAQIETVVIGAGPIGIQTAAVLAQAGRSVCLIDKGGLASQIAAWPLFTQFFSSPEWIAIAGVPFHSVHQGMVSGEEYTSYLRTVVEVRRIDFRPYRECVSVSGSKGAFTLKLRSPGGAHSQIRCAHIVCAVGEMSIPFIPDIPGRQLPHVLHGYSDPHLFFGTRVLIVGGRNSAIEAAVRLWRAGAGVALSYRGPEIEQNRIISRLFLDFDMIRRQGGVEFYPSSQVREIHSDRVVIESDQRFEHHCDFVVFATGYEPDRRLYHELGIDLLGEEQRPSHDPQSMETNVPGVYVAGTGIAGKQQHFTTFITTCHRHALNILAHLEGSEPLPPQGRVGNAAPRFIEVSSKDVE